MSENNEQMEISAVLSEAVYRKGKTAKLNDVNKYYPNRFEIQPETDSNHLVVKDSKTGKIHVAIAGTDIENEKGNRLKDLGTDALVTFGLGKLGNRYRSSDKKVSLLKEKHGKDNLVLSGHSLGGSIVSDLVHKHDIEGHSFNRGGSHHTFSTNKYKALHPTHRERAKKNNVYLTAPSLSGSVVDPLSIGTSADPLANVKFIQPKKLKKGQEGVISHHSVHHFTPEPVSKTSKKALPTFAGGEEKVKVIKEEIPVPEVAQRKARKIVRL